MGKATNPRRIDPRSKGGRPRQEGERTKGGRLKHKPNERVMQMRAIFGVDHIGQAFSPIQIAFKNGWLSEVDCRTASEFASLYAAAGMGRSSISLSAGMEVKPGADTTGDVTAASFFATLPHHEVAAIWDAVFTDDGARKLTGDETAARAMKRWKIACRAMTSEQRQEVQDVCILDSFPQWIIQRAHGNMGTSWERKRDMLIGGLSAIRRALHPTQPKAQQEAPRRGALTGTGAVQVARTIYVDEAGEKVLEVERRARRSAA